MDWPTWLKYKAVNGASKSLEVCDSMGEKLAWWFGITQPKYLYEIEEYLRMQKEQESDDEEIEIRTIKVEAKVEEDAPASAQATIDRYANSEPRKPYQM